MKKSKKYTATNENGNRTYKTYACSKSRSKREVHSNNYLPKETRKISKKPLNFTHQGDRKKKNK